MGDIALFNGAINLTYTNVATIFVDIAAMFFLLGMIPCTRVYRKRGRLSDRLFFAMILVDIAMAAGDALVDFFTQSTLTFTPPLAILGGSVMNISFGFMSLLLMLYLMCFLPSGEELVKKWYKVSLIPAVATMILILINAFTGFLFYVDPLTGSYLHGPFYNLIAIELIIYALVGLFILWKVNRLGIVLFIILVATRLIMEALFVSVSSTPFVFAVVLVYCLVGSMNRSFHQVGAKPVKEKE